MRKSMCWTGAIPLGMWFCCMVVATLAGCSDNRVSLLDQWEYFERQQDLWASGDLPARRLLLRTFLELDEQKWDRFHFCLLDLREPAKTGCRMADMARADVADGDFNILMVGDTFIPWEIEEKMWEYLSARYGIEHMSFGHGGCEFWQYYDLIDEYNRVVEQAIKREFGRERYEFWREAREAVESAAADASAPGGEPSVEAHAGAGEQTQQDVQNPQDASE